MAALPKMIYGGTKIGTVMYNEKEVFNIVEQQNDENSRTIYHKHRGNKNQKGGCYTIRKEKTETSITEHFWTRGDEIDSGTFEGDVVEGESNASSHFHWKRYRCTDQFGNITTLYYIYWCSETSARKVAGSWELEDSSAYNNGRNASGGNSNNYGTDWSQLWDTHTTQNTEEKTITYYDLGCGFETK